MNHVLKTYFYRFFSENTVFFPTLKKSILSHLLFSVPENGELHEAPMMEPGELTAEEEEDETALNLLLDSSSEEAEVNESAVSALNANRTETENTSQNCTAEDEQMDDVEQVTDVENENLIDNQPITHNEEDVQPITHPEEEDQPIPPIDQENQPIIHNTEENQPTTHNEEENQPITAENEEVTNDVSEANQLPIANSSKDES